MDKNNPALDHTKGKSILGMGFQHGMSAWGAMSDYKDARNQGHGQMYSMAKAGTEFAMGELLGWKYLPYQMLKALPSAAVGVAEGAAKLQRSMNKTSRQTPFGNAQFRDYNQAFTMRQAGMRAAENSKYNLQQALMGNEASHLRR